MIGEVSFHSNESGYFADEDNDVEDDVSGQYVNLVWMWRKLTILLCVATPPPVCLELLQFSDHVCTNIRTLKCQ